MNLADGKILKAEDCGIIVDNLESRITNTLSKKPLDTEAVLSACDRLVRKLSLEEYMPVLSEIGIDAVTAGRYILDAKKMFSRKALEYRLKTELGENYNKVSTVTLPQGKILEEIKPLGVLLHIAAGNADALPAFSVLEGLLAGNINILKLPELDGGISVRILKELISEEPALSEYIYVFDYSSKDLDSMQKLINAADAVVIWGGDTAVSSLRSMINPNTKLIEWGHKISFAYAANKGINDDSLKELAINICGTNQLLCSSCQGVYVDTDCMVDIYSFCERFLPVLEQTALEHKTDMGIGVQSQITLQLLNEELEASYKNSRIFRGENSSIIAYPDSRLEPALQFRNCWVRPLPKNKLLEVLRPYKNHLQTSALLCGDDERLSLTEMLAKTGVVRVTSGKNMSETYPGAAHDGEFSLRRYTKIFSSEF